jgi:hypothetical protein
VTWPERVSHPAASTLPARIGETVISSTHICCGQRLRRHGVEPQESRLGFTYCGQCESLRWFREDLPIATEASTLEQIAGLPAGGAAAMRQAETQS